MLLYNKLIPKSIIINVLMTITNIPTSNYYYTILLLLVLLATVLLVV